MVKKWISVLLSALFVLSCCSAAFVAFAESPNNVQGSEEYLNLSEDTTAFGKGADASETGSGQGTEPGTATNSEKSGLLSQEDKEQLYELGDKLYGIGKDTIDALASEEALEKYQKIFSQLSETTAAALTNTVSTGAVGKFNAMVEAYEGKVSVSQPTEADLKGYNEILSAYAGLTNEEKSQVDLFMFDKMLHLILDREKQVSIQNNPDVASYNKQHYINAEVAAENILGAVGYAAYFSEAKELYTVMNDSKKTADEKFEAYKSANQYARIYSDLWYSSYASFYYKLDSSNIGKNFMKLAQEYGKLYLAEDPFTETAPTVPSKPNKNDYSLGEDDPAYIEAYNTYMAGSKAKAEYDCRKNMHTAACNIKGVQKAEGAASEFAGLADFMNAAVAAVQAFDQDSSQLAPAKAVRSTFGKMNVYLQTVILNNTTIKVYCEPKEYSTYWSTSQKSTKDVYNQCVDIGEYDKLSAFVAVIKEIEEPYNNEDIQKAKEAYENVPSGLQSFVPAEIQAKYEAILACIGPDLPSFEMPDLSIFKKTTVTYPTGVSPAQVDKALPRLESLINDILLPILGVDNGLQGLINTSLYTNATIAEVCKFLYPTLGELSSLISASPSELAEKLTEEKYQGAVTALKAIGDDWNALTLSNGDMGFQDGDKEGFLDAFAALFRPLSIVTVAVKLENTIDTSKGIYTYGAYEDLVPIFEALDLKGYLSSHEYTLYVNEVNEKNSDMVMDARVRPILVPIFNLIDQFAQNPLDTLVTVLPKIGFVLKTDLLSKQIAALLGKISLISIDPPDLSAGALFDMLAPMLQNLDLNGTSISITLNKDNFLKFLDDIGGCGNAIWKNSKIRGKAYSLGVDPDKSDAFLVMFRWLYGELTSAQNSQAIQTAIDSSTLGTVPKSLIKSAWNSISKLPADTAIAVLINLTAPALPSFDNVPGSNLPNTDSSNGSNAEAEKNSNSAKPDNPSIPKTGGGVAVSLFALAATAGLAGGAVLLKKKIENSKD